MAEAAGVDVRAAQKHLSVLAGAELLTVCKYTGSVSINRSVFNQFKDWVLVRMWMRCPMTLSKF